MSANPDLQYAFASYCAAGATEMDGRSFTKLCKDCSLIDKAFSATDADLVFAKAVAKGQRKIGFAEFELALIFVADRRGCHQKEVFDIVADAGGPSLKGTKAEPVRFHDDKGTYTGTHSRGGPELVPKGLGHVPQGVPWPAKEPAAGPRRSSSRSSLTEGGRAALGNLPNLLVPPTDMRKRSTSRTPSELSVPSAPRSRSSSRQPSPCSDGPALFGRRDVAGGLLEFVFDSYCGMRSDMDGKSFAKLIKDSGLLDRTFTTTDADLAFAKAGSKGQRRIDLQQFRSALLHIAEKKGVEAGTVFQAVSRQSGGPQIMGTKADAVRFHDDLNTYTGVHANGGPESVAKGSGTASQLASASMRYSAA
eukprot:gb/GFBE01044114.1/.p1 GENE.gb/GFBE01044114.1/~~gb/GFBE01044114.1/.p1  ORF type:complete len:363 (+),score=71.57 gb/GFBE01044114.1/:1-1089(+)